MQSTTSKPTAWDNAHPDMSSLGFFVINRQYSSKAASMHSRSWIDNATGILQGKGIRRVDYAMYSTWNQEQIPCELYYVCINFSFQKHMLTSDSWFCYFWTIAAHYTVMQYLMINNSMKYFTNSTANTILHHMSKYIIDLPNNNLVQKVNSKGILTQLKRKYTMWSG